MKIKKIAVLCMTLLAVLLGTTFTATAQAATYEIDASVPTFGLNCEEEGIIKKGSVKFDLTNSEMFSNKRALKQADYVVSGNKAVTFEIPFLSTYTEIPQFGVTVNGQAVEGEVWYGDNAVRYFGKNPYLGALNKDNSVIKEKLKMVYSPKIDENIAGTLYTVIPDKDIMTVTLKIGKSCSYVYDGNNRQSESYKPDRTQEWTYENALSQKSYQYFFVGEDIEFTADCEIQTQEITFKDFIGSNYDETAGAPIACLYANANRVLHNKGGMAFSEFFYNSLNREGLNTYRFTVQLNGEATIKYSSEVVLQADYRYEPTVYLVGHKQLGSYTTDFSITLNSEAPYIVESGVATKKSKKTYTASSNENFYFICCSAPWEAGLSTSQLVICIVCGIIGGIALIGLVVSIIFIIRDARRNR